MRPLCACLRGLSSFMIWYYLSNTHTLYRYNEIKHSIIREDQWFNSTITYFTSKPNKDHVKWYVCPVAIVCEAPLAPGDTREELKCTGLLQTVCSHQPNTSALEIFSPWDLTQGQLDGPPRRERLGIHFWGNDKKEYDRNTTKNDS